MLPTWSISLNSLISPLIIVRLKSLRFWALENRLWWPSFNFFFTVFRVLNRTNRFLKSQINSIISSEEIYIKKIENLYNLLRKLGKSHIKFLEIDDNNLLDDGLLIYFEIKFTTNDCLRPIIDSISSNSNGQNWGSILLSRYSSQKPAVYTSLS